jgi:hypothetical protein
MPDQRACRLCEKPFFPTRAWERLCSPRCRKSWRNQRNLKNRRLRQQGAPKGLTAQAVRGLLEFQDWKCAACRTQLPISTRGRVPWSRYFIWGTPLGAICPLCYRALKYVRRATVPIENIRFLVGWARGLGRARPPNPKPSYVPDPPELA